MEMDKEVEKIIIKKSQKWLEAARKCDKRCVEERIVRVAKELQDFLESEYGKIALHGLLRATNKHVLFVKNNRYHPDIPEEVFILTNVGPMRVRNTLTGSLVIPVATPIALTDLVKATVEYANKTPETLLLFLLNELDKIAESIQ